jgi:uncharacterized protein YgbK (DUF1537 family)
MLSNMLLNFKEGIMDKLVIIADDLTGATDSGVQFSCLGYNTSVVFKVEELEDLQNEVVVIDTDSRSILPEAAYQKVYLATKEIKHYEYSKIFKKVDSTLRGNFGIEIDAVLDVFQECVAIIAPAFPSIGRTTIYGHHYVHGVPIHETEFAQDPSCPVLTSHIGELLMTRSRRKVEYIDKDLLLGGVSKVSEKLCSLKEEGIQYIVCDAETDSDLQVIVDGVIQSRIKAVWVGSAGLAVAIRNSLHLIAKFKVEEIIQPQGGPVLIVAGSLSKTTNEQITQLQIIKSIQKVIMDPIALIEGEESRLMERSRCIHAVLAIIEKSEDAILVSITTYEKVKQAQEVGAKKGLTTSDVSNIIADELGKITSQILAHRSLRGLILTGGDTARSVCRNSGITGIKLDREIETGIPLGRLLGAGNIPVVTKAGAFGTKTALVKALAALKGELTYV